MFSAAGEFRINENSTSVQSVSVLPYVGLLIVELSLPHTVNQLGLIRHLVQTVGGLVQVFTEAGTSVLLGLPNG